MKKIIALFISCVTVFQLQAQVPTEKALLWKISGNKLKSPSYLFGTMHLMCPDQLKMDEAIVSTFNTTKQLYLEIDLDDPQMMMKAMKLMMMPKGENLEKLVGKTDYDSMNVIYKSLAGMSLQMMSSAKPLLLMSSIFPALLNCKPEGWEKKFQDLAKPKNMPVNGLETIEYQMRVFDTIPYQVQANMFKELLFNIDSSKKSFYTMVNMYLDKDINSLYKLGTNDPQFGEYEALMLNNRNANWIPVMDVEMNKMPTFFAVGAAHLGGENGVISLLRKRGYTVKPVLY